MTGLADAFAHFGVTGKNQRWSWSARSTNGDVVVLTLWRDHFDYSTNPPRYYANADLDSSADWLDRPGNRERLENLIWAEDNCGGEFRVIVIEPVDPNAKPRQIKNCYPKDRMVGRIIKLNRESGEFEAEILDRKKLNA